MHVEGSIPFVQPLLSSGPQADDDDNHWKDRIFLEYELEEAFRFYVV